MSLSMKLWMKTNTSKMEMVPVDRGKKPPKLSYEKIPGCRRSPFTKGLHLTPAQNLKIVLDSFSTLGFCLAVWPSCYLWLSRKFSSSWGHRSLYLRLLAISLQWAKGKDLVVVADLLFHSFSFTEVQGNTVMSLTSTTAFIHSGLIAVIIFCQPVISSVILLNNEQLKYSFFYIL